MELSLTSLLALARHTLRYPRAGARFLLDQDLAPGVRWLAFLLVAVASAIGTHLSITVMPPDQRAVLEQMFASPIRTAIMQGTIWLGIAWLIAIGGRLRGGRGSFMDALLLVTWLEFILLCIQVLQVVAGFLLPPIGDIIGLAGLVMLAWLLTNFVAELHGFASLWAVFAGLVAGGIALFLGVAVLLALLVGAPVPGG